MQKTRQLMGSHSCFAEGLPQAVRSVAAVSPVPELKLHPLQDMPLPYQVTHGG